MEYTRIKHTVIRKLRLSHTFYISVYEQLHLLIHSECLTHMYKNNQTQTKNKIKEIHAVVTEVAVGIELVKLGFFEIRLTR